jgi:hypothetical protein
MNNLLLLSSFGASFSIHLILIPVLCLGLSNRYSQPRLVPVELVEISRLEQVEKPKVVSLPPQ